MHPHPDSSKLPTFALQFGNQIRRSLANNGGNRAGIHREHQLRALGIGDPHAIGKRARQVAAHDGGHRGFAAATGDPAGDGRIRGQDAGERLWRTCHRAGSGFGRGEDDDNGAAPAQWGTGI